MVTIRKVKNYFKNISKQNNELLWARIWDDTKKGIEWIEDMPGISPGRWAVGYNYLYVMTRILNELQPRKVLDLGLGISSTLISSYFNYMKYSNEGGHTIVEQDQSWADFYTSKNRISEVSTLEIRKCISKNYDGCTYNAYDDFKSAVDGKYQVISIDGPKGSSKHSRRDIIELLPDILEDNFVIVIDDAERDGEKATINEIKNILSKHSVKYCSEIYVGKTDVCVIASVDNRFLCSM